jgi:hypothetical protein
MFAFTKWAGLLGVTPLLAGAMLHGHCREVVLEKTLEGLAGGLMVGLVLAYSKLERLRHHESLTLRRAVCLVRRELCTGLVAGLLVGLVLSSIVLLVG